MCGRPGSGRSPNASGPKDCPLWATRPTWACPRWSSARSKAGASRSGRRTSTPNTLSCAGPVNGRSPSSSSGASCAAYAAAPTAPARSLVPCSCFSSEKQDEKGSLCTGSFFLGFARWVIFSLYCPVLYYSFRRNPRHRSFFARNHLPVKAQVGQLHGTQEDDLESAEIEAGGDLCGAAGGVLSGGASPFQG